MFQLTVGDPLWMDVITLNCAVERTDVERASELIILPAILLQRHRHATDLVVFLDLNGFKIRQRPSPRGLIESKPYLSHGNPISHKLGWIRGCPAARRMGPTVLFR